MGQQKYLSKIIFFFAVVTLLSCCNPVASFFLPKVTRTNDAVIIDCKSNEFPIFKTIQIFAKCDNNDFKFQLRARDMLLAPFKRRTSTKKLPIQPWLLLSHFSILTP
jgi:hypothetical protein